MNGQTIRALRDVLEELLTEVADGRHLVNDQLSPDWRDAMTATIRVLGRELGASAGSAYDVSLEAVVREGGALLEVANKVLDNLPYWG